MTTNRNFADAVALIDAPSKMLVGVPYVMAFLDQIAPGWEQRVNLADLDLATSSRCILGQVFGGYAAGLQALRNAGGSTSLAGNAICSNHYCRDEWIAAITARRAQRAA